MIYMNNAATGFPKFSSTLTSMNTALRYGNIATNRESVKSGAADIVFNLRNKISGLIHATQPHEICLTPSDTIALNMIMQGMDFGKHDVLLIDSMSHNAIARPAMALAKSKGIVVVCIGSIAELGIAIKEYGSDIRAAVFSHGSNVTGDVIDAEKIGQILHEKGIPFILDAAQTIGLYPIDVEKFHVSALAFAGHKGLNGMQGTGGFYIRNGFQLTPILFGGTGNESASLIPEVIYPDSFEVGTPATHDLIGTYFSIMEIEKIGYEKYAQSIRDVAQYAYDELSKINGVILYGKEKKDVPVVSFNVMGLTCKEVGTILGAKGFICRTGVHCAGLAAKKLDVLNKFGGTVRVSFGYKNTKQEVDELVKTIEKFC